MTTLTPTEIHEEMKTRYGRIADEFKVDVSASCCDDKNSNILDSDCCGVDEAQSEALFQNIYTADTKWLPADVTELSLGCGDPITLAGLQQGQTVLDLGSGGGIDCFMAARQVGPTGHVIGVDMTPSMLEKANTNKKKVELDNVEFRLGKIEDLPVDNDSVDVILSNCVINLAPDKTAVFQEAYRVLKPGGKLAVSDMVTQGNYSDEERADMAAWSGCITGAEDIVEYIAGIQSAGFDDISVRDKANPEVELNQLHGNDGQAKLFSARVTAVKPL